MQFKFQAKFHYDNIKNIFQPYTKKIELVEFKLARILLA